MVGCATYTHFSLFMFRMEKKCPFILKTVTLCVATRKLEDLTLSKFVSKYCNSLAVRCASTAFKIASDMEVFRKNISSEIELLN